MKNEISTSENFLCPIRNEIMRDPVDAADEHTYERCAIQRWFLLGMNSPFTKLPFPNKKLEYNSKLKEKTEELKEFKTHKVENFEEMYNVVISEPLEVQIRKKEENLKILGNWIWPQVNKTKMQKYIKEMLIEKYIYLQSELEFLKEEESGSRNFGAIHFKKNSQIPVLDVEMKKLSLSMPISDELNVWGDIKKIDEAALLLPFDRSVKLQLFSFSAFASSKLTLGDVFQSIEDINLKDPTTLRSQLNEFKNSIDESIENFFKKSSEPLTLLNKYYSEVLLTTQKEVSCMLKDDELELNEEEKAIMEMVLDLDLDASTEPAYTQDELEILKQCESIQEDELATSVEEDDILKDKIHLNQSSMFYNSGTNLELDSKKLDYRRIVESEQNKKPEKSNSPCILM